MKINSTKIIKFGVPIFIGLAIRIFYAKVMPLTNDEGSYLYDGYLLSKGIWPFAHSFSRAPSLMVIIAIFTKIFREGILMGRVISIALGIGSSFLVYWIGRNLINERVGYYSFLSYLIIPAVSIHNIRIHTQTLEMFFILFAVALFIKAMKQKSYSNYALSGIFWGLSVLSRESSAIFPIIFVVYYLVAGWKGRRNFFNFLLYPFVMGVSALAVWGGVWILIAHSVGWEKVIAVFKALATMHDTGEVWSVGFTLKKKVEVVSAWMNENFIFYFFGLLFMYYISAFVLGLSKKISKIILCALYISLSAILLPNFFNFRYSGLGLPFQTAVFLLGLFFLVVGFNYTRKIESKAEDLFLFMLIGISPLLFYGIYYRRLQPGYFAEFMPAFSLISGFTLASLNFKKKVVLRGIAIILVFISVVYSFKSISTLPHSGTFYLASVNEVTEWIKGNSKADDEIFTSAVIFPYLAGRKLALNISRPVIFGYPHLREDIKYTLFPKDEDIIEYLEQRKVRFVIIEKSMRDSFFNYHDDIRDYVFGNYHTAGVFENKGNPIEVHELN